MTCRPKLRRGFHMSPRRAVGSGPAGELKPATAILSGAGENGRARIVLSSSFSVAQSRRVLSRSEEHTSELQSPCNLVCRLLLEKKKNHQHVDYCCRRCPDEGEDLVV